jgi:hypothetical protein
LPLRISACSDNAAIAQCCASSSGDADNLVINLITDPKRFSNHCGASWREIHNATRRTTMPYSLAEAAAATGMNKTSILRAIKSGKISGSKDEHGQWLVEPAELHRVYAPVECSDASTDASSTAEGETPRYAAPEDVELRIRAAAERELAALKDMIAEVRAQRDDLLTQRDDLRAQREDMQAQRDVWQAEAQRLALPPPATEKGEPAPDPVTASAGARLRGFLFESDPVWNWWRRRSASRAAG